MSSRDKLITVALNYPLEIRLKINSERLKQNVARRIVSATKRALKNERSLAGESLKRGEDDGPALRDSGALIKSISYKKGTIAPRGGRGKINNAGILGVRISEGVGNPLATNTVELERKLNELAEKEIQRQTEKNEAGLLMELGLKKKGRRR